MGEYIKPFIKVEWEDTVENHSPERIKRVKAYFKKKYNTNDVRIVTRTLTNDSSTKLKSLDAGESIFDLQYQKRLIQEFMTENKITIDWNLIDRLDNKVNSELNKIEEINNQFNKWFIKRVEFSNFLSYGDDNVLDFTSLGGITVIESNPKNFGGKTTMSIDLLMFLFFNKTYKSKTNLEIFNIYRNDVNEVKVKGFIEIDGDDYIIERIITRRMTKSGEYDVKTKLEFFKNVNGELLNLSGEQRRETEKFITSTIGSEEDFLMTILTTGYNMEDLIDSKPTARGLILTRFLGLEILKKKEEICKTMFSNWSKNLISNTYNIVSLTDDNVSLLEKKEQLINTNIKLKDDLKNSESSLKELENNRDSLLKIRNNDIDSELIHFNVDVVTNNKKKCEDELSRIKNQIDLIIVNAPSKYYNENEHDELNRKQNDLSIKIKVTDAEVKNKEKFIENLINSKVCPTCKQSIDTVDHTEEIKKINEEIDALKLLISVTKTEYDEVSELIKSFEGLKKSYELYEREKLRKSKTELEYEMKKIEILSYETKIDKYNTNKKKLDDNKKIDDEIIILRTKIDTLNGSIRMVGNDIEKNKVTIISYDEKIKTNIELIEKIKIEDNFRITFTSYLSIFGKNGISKTILKNMTPLLNQELQYLMNDSCLFTLKLVINEKNDLEFLMLDNETCIVKSLSTGSGYEKTISALAIRAVLTKVSTLPKPNIVVMDEIFGKVANDNLDLIGLFFQKIKHYFEHILIVSHNELIRNWSDNLIMVKKDENVSVIEYMNIKSH